VTAFWRSHGGSLRAIGTLELAPGAAGTAQVSVMPDGRSLVISERVANRLETLPLDRYGRPGTPVLTVSSSSFPFRFGISQQGTIVVSEAGASTVSSYRPARDGAPHAVTASLAVGQGAACWVAVSPNGRFAYPATRPGASAASRSPGRVADADRDHAAGPSPRDLHFDASGRYLHTVSPGGQATVYRVGDDGSLALSDTAPAASGITGAAAL
jgi:6-phosphogluconolactonase (cycloisomerase 2 family)